MPTDNRTKQAKGETGKYVAPGPELQPHQEEVVSGQDRRIAWHALGSGKTLTGLMKAKAMIEKTGKPALFVVPAPLVENIHKEIAKHNIDIPKDMIHVMSYQKAAKANLKDIDPGIVVVDEAHRLRNSGVSSNAVMESIKRAPGTLPMTGTLMYNSYHDIIPLVNAVAADPSAGKLRGKAKTALPDNPAAFDDMYIKENIIHPSLWNKYIHDVKPGVSLELKNVDKLQKVLQSHIHYHKLDNPNFPSSSTEVVKVDMSEDQHLLYKAMMGEIPGSLRRKIEAGLPPSKKELSSMMAFMTGPRIASTSSHSYASDRIKGSSTKIDESTRRLIEAKSKDPNFKAVVYSNFIDAGVTPATKAMTEGGLRVGVFTGSVSTTEKKRLREDFNDGKLDVLALSSSGSEGLDLKGVKHIHILDPHFNEGKIRQVIGRGVRYKSHEHLPEEERHVHITRFLSTLPQKKSLGGLIKHKREVSTDEYLHNLAGDKQGIQDKIENLVKTAEALRYEEQPEGILSTAARYGKNAIVGTVAPTFGTLALLTYAQNKLGGSPYGTGGVLGIAAKKTIPVMAGVGAVGAILGAVRNIYGPRPTEWRVIDEK